MQISKVERLVNHLVLHSNDTPNIGLFDGKMGFVIVLFHYGHIHKSREFNIVAEKLLDNILSSLTTHTPINFATGLTGIGWGIEYLIQNNYIKGDSADICEVIDHKLMNISFKRLTDLTLETGIEGYLHYLNAHLQGIRNAFAYPDFLYEVREKLNSLMTDHPNCSAALCSLCNNYNSFFYSPIQYKFCPSEFYISSQITPPRGFLGLRRGISGYIETTLVRKYETTVCNR